jgi:hypothetical protein
MTVARIGTAVARLAEVAQLAVRAARQLVAAFLIALEPDQAAPSADDQRTAVDTTAAHIRALLTRSSAAVQPA